MKIKTSELTGAALDYAVSLITNPEWTDEDRWYNTLGYVDFGDLDDEPYMPSENWAQGGPIIEQEGIEVVRGNDLIFPKGNEKGEYTEPLWLASCGGGRKFHGPTPLIAAMRCLVATKLGDEVEIPDELVPPSRTK